MGEYIIASCTDTGRVRSVNEDSMVTFESPNGTVVVVSDGMGGQNAGDVASQLAVAVIRDILSDNTFSTPQEAIIRSVMAANQAILHRASMDQNLAGMGATCVMLIIKDGKVYYGSVGDSRIYYVEAGMIRQLTKDQSYVQTLVDAGELTAEAAEHHKDKNQITNALGLEEMTPPVVGQTPITPGPGGVFVLCSDGLSGMINNNAILTTVSRSNLSLQERAALLVKLANEAGGNDNITVQLVEFPAQVGGAAAVAPVRTVSDEGVSVASGLPIKNKKNNKNLIWALVALIVVILAGGVIWWCLREPEQKVTQSATVKKAPAPTPTPEPQKAQEQSQPSQTKIVVIEEPAKSPNKDKGKTTPKKPENKVTEKEAIKGSATQDNQALPEEKIDNRANNKVDSLKEKFGK